MKVKLINENFKENYGENLLHARGIEDINKFLNPDESCLQTWHDLDNIEPASICIYCLKDNARVGLVVD